MSAMWSLMCRLVAGRAAHCTMVGIGIFIEMVLNCETSRICGGRQAK